MVCLRLRLIVLTYCSLDRYLRWRGMKGEEQCRGSEMLAERDHSQEKPCKAEAYGASEAVEPQIPARV